MATTRFFLDTRRSKPGHPCVIKVAIGHLDQTTYVSTMAKVLPEQWDEESGTVIHHPDSQILNVHIRGVRQSIDRTILLLNEAGKLKTMTAKDIRNEAERAIHPERAENRARREEEKNLFITRFLKFADSKKPGTRGIYMHTYARLQAFAGDKLKRLHFEDITKEWLTKFENFLAETSPSKNSRNIHLRNIRAVFNEAIDDEVTTFYPFRRFHIRPVATPKRNLKVQDLRKFFNYPCEEFAVKYRDMFKLMFMLIGINCIDLAHLKEVRNGRIEFYRAKTNRLYSIKVEPEAQEIIDRYPGKDWLLPILDHWKDHHDFTLKMNHVLKKIGPVKRVGLGGKKIYDPLFPKISTYWARHSWATIAASLDIPKETIAHALGHGGNTVTDIYIEFDQRKVDQANRMVLDWVLYGKKPRYTGVPMPATIEEQNTAPDGTFSVANSVAVSVADSDAKCVANSVEKSPKSKRATKSKKQRTTPASHPTPKTPKSQPAQMAPATPIVNSDGGYTISVPYGYSYGMSFYGNTKS